MTISEIKHMVNNGKRIALYCAGKYGIAYKNLFDFLGIKIDCFLDNEVEKHGMIVEGIICRKPESIANKEDYITVLCVRRGLYPDLLGIAKAQHIVNICDCNVLWDALIQDKALFVDVLVYLHEFIKVDLLDTQIKTFENHSYIQKLVSFDRIAVYTAMFGDYDGVHQPTAFPDNVDYYYISDVKPEPLGTYKWIDAKSIIPDSITNPVMRNRYVKMFPHKFFKKYKYSIYIDANIQVRCDLSTFMLKAKSGISTFLHPNRDCAYCEALSVAILKKDIPLKTLAKQVDGYISDGFPAHFGMAAMNFIYRDHSNNYCRKVMDTWWEEFCNKSFRDQLSFTYALWKNGMSMKDIGILGTDIFSFDGLEILQHKR